MSRAPSQAGCDISSALLAAATNPDVSHAAFRIYGACVARFGAHAFTADQAAEIAGVELRTAWQLLGGLAKIGLLRSNRLTEVGRRPDGRPIRRTLYRAAGV